MNDKAKLDQADYERLVALLKTTRNALRCVIMDAQPGNRLLVIQAIGEIDTWFEANIPKKE